jgi:hypothetical protein
VLPDRSLPLNGPEFRRVVRELLEKASLSIHLVGANYGVIPDGESESIVALQHRLALEHRAAGGARVIWMRPGAEQSDERQKHLIEYLLGDADVQRGAELLRTPLEELKTAIHDAVERQRRPEVATPVAQRAAHGVASVYLVCDEQDREAVAPLEDWLFEQGFDVTLPASDGDEAAVREDHQQNLLLCDGVLVYAGRASELWLRAQLRELLKAPGYGRTHPFAAKAIYLGAPESPWKSRFRSHEAQVIARTSDVTPAALAPFVDELRRPAGRQP